MRYTKKQKKKIIKQFQDSKLSIRQFCENGPISRNSLTKWIKNNAEDRVNSVSDFCVENKLLNYCKNVYQETIIKTIQAAGTVQAAAEELDISYYQVRNVYRIVKAKASMQGFAPEHDMTKTVPDTHFVKGVSSMYDRDGNLRLQWVKSDAKAQSIIEGINAVVEGLKEDIEPIKAVPAPVHCLENLLNLYVVTDYHMGMLSSVEETGADWDMKIAEETLLRWLQVAIDTSPNSKHAVFANIGDFLHFDGLEPVTNASGHVLDASARFFDLIKAATRVLRQCVGMLLEKHETVHVLMADANHDERSEGWLRVLFAALYENEPRVTVEQSHDTYYCHEFGQTSLFFHHGHKRKPSNVDHVFVAKFRDVFGRTKYSYAHMGHLHHVDAKETNLMIVEQHRTLAASDAYGSRGGWLSGRDAKVITYHKMYGEVSRLTINSDMLK